MCSSHVEVCTSTDNSPPQLCWTCSERQRNETLSSDEDVSGSGSDDSDSTFITNRFEDLDVGGPTHRHLAKDNY